MLSSVRAHPTRTMTRLGYGIVATTRAQSRPPVADGLGPRLGGRGRSIRSVQNTASRSTLGSVVAVTPDSHPTSSRSCDSQ